MLQDVFARCCAVKSCTWGLCACACSRAVWFTRGTWRVRIIHNTKQKISKVMLWSWWLSMSHISCIIDTCFLYLLSKIADNLDVQQSASGLTFVVHVICTGESVRPLAFAEMFGGFVVWNVLFYSLNNGQQIHFNFDQGLIPTNYPREWILAPYAGAVTVIDIKNRSRQLCSFKVSAVTLVFSTAVAVDTFLFLVLAELQKGEN